MSNKISMLIEDELSKLSEKERKLLKDKLKKQQESNKFTSESLRKIIDEEVNSLNEAGVDKLKNELELNLNHNKFLNDANILSLQTTFIHSQRCKIRHFRRQATVLRIYLGTD